MSEPHARQDIHAPKSPAIWSPSKPPAATNFAALQLQRLKWSLQHAYDNVPHYRQKAFDDKGVHPAI
jgi:phenylacetate-CoA ligase